ncbi:hypothetical protein, partial [Micromonospora sp. NPDC005171]|uniref:hypothetical protein n=1 Tax=Micromonospora sp. NPDC005171 TaxID=3156866 RepID=UPI0033AE0529
MPNDDGFQVDPDDLTSHAAHIERNADGLDTARQAGQHVQLSADAYGQLCAIMPLLLDGLQRTLVDWACPVLTDIRDQGTWGLREDVHHHGEHGEEA